MENKYDILFIGAGLHNAVMARLATNDGYKCCVVEKRPHIAGNIYDENVDGIMVHTYGPHVFHTSDDDVWDFVNKYTKFNDFTFNIIANYNGEIYNLPFNMNTFNKMWGVTNPEDAKQIIENQRKISGVKEPKNLEEQAISLVGTDIYEKLIKGYTEKQWGRKCIELPSFIIKRLPVRFIYNNNYFNDKYQGIPKGGGYTKFIKNLLSNCDIILNTDYLENKEYFDSITDKVVYSGCIDEYFGYRFGKLEYRSVYWKTTKKNVSNYQGCAVMNYTSSNVPYTRVIEHKHFEPLNESAQNLPYTIISEEYSVNNTDESIPSYPINDETNTNLYNRYKELTKNEPNVIFGGRLAEYKYYDMDKVIKSAMVSYNNNFNKEKGEV